MGCTLSQPFLADPAFQLVDPSRQPPTLATLNEDVLTEILSYLSTWELYQVARVCKVLLNLSRRSLDASVDLYGTHDGSTSLSTKLLSDPVRRGRIRRLRLTHDPHRMTSSRREELYSWLSLLPSSNVHTLSLTQYGDDEDFERMVLLSPGLSSVKELIWETMYTGCSVLLQTYLAQMPSLKTLTFPYPVHGALHDLQWARTSSIGTSNIWISPQVPPSLTRLSLCSFHLCPGIKTLLSAVGGTLLELHIVLRQCRVSEELAQALAEHVPHLRRLTVIANAAAGYRAYPLLDGIVSQLYSLEYLYCGYTTHSDQLLTRLPSSLRHLELECCFIGYPGVPNDLTPYRAKLKQARENGLLKLTVVGHQRYGLSYLEKACKYAGIEHRIRSPDV